MIVFLLVCLFGGIVLAGILAPVLMAHNYQVIKEMRRLVERYHEITAGMPQADIEPIKQTYKAKLRELKEKVWVGDKKALEVTHDLMVSVE